MATETADNKKLLDAIAESQRIEESKRVSTKKLFKIPTLEIFNISYFYFSLKVFNFLIIKKKVVKVKF